MLWWTLKRLKSRNWLTRKMAVDKLGKSKDERVVKPLINALRDTDFFVQTAAAEALGKIGDRRAVEPLINALRVSPTKSRGYVQTAVINALCEIGDERAIEPLIAKLKGSDRHAHRDEIDALVRFGEPTIQPLLGVLKDKDAYARRAAAKALEGLKWKPSDDVQRALLAVSNEQWDEAAGFKAAAIEPLVTALKHWGYEQRGAAAGTLTKLQWQPEDDEQRAWLAIAQGKCDEVVSLKSAAVEPLLHAQRKGDALDALVKIGEAAMEPLLAALKDKDHDVRNVAAEALEMMGDRRAIEPLVAMLKSTYSQDIRAAARALGELGDRRAVESLLAALKDKNAAVRETAAQALGKIGDARAVEPLIAALKDHSYTVVGTAAFALGQIGDARAVMPLVAFRDEKEIVRDETMRVYEKMREDEYLIGDWWDPDQDLFDVLRQGQKDAQHNAAIALQMIHGSAIAHR
jgi:HEAT repeat protein